MNEQEQIERLQQNRHLIAGGVYTAATVEQVAGWIQTTCELAMRWIDVPKVTTPRGIPHMITLHDDDRVTVVRCPANFSQPPIIDLTRKREVAAVPLPAAMPRVEIIEDDGEVT